MEKPTNKVLLIILSIALVIAYILFANIYGNHFKTKVNDLTVIELKERPRLEDDYYNYVNYELLKTNNIKEDEETWSTLSTEPMEKIEAAKHNAIKDILSKCETYEGDSVNKKICDFYDSYKNLNQEKINKNLKKYIDKINKVETINGYINTVLEIDKELSLDILFNPGANRKTDVATSYFGFNALSYDIDNGMLSEYSVDLTSMSNDLYTNKEYASVIRYLNKYSKNNLMIIGYTDEEASKIASNAQLFYTTIAKESLSSTKYNNHKGYDLYSLDELQSELSKIKLDKIVSNYDSIYNAGEKILVTDVKQLKAVDKFLVKKNLQTLKDYAISKIVNKYAPDTNMEAYTNYLKLYDYLLYTAFGQVSNKAKEIDEEKLIYDKIYSSFMDTIAHDIEESIMTPEEKAFYEELVLTEIETFKENIKEEKWLTSETRDKAYNKISNLSYQVSLPEDPAYVEKNYTITDNYLENIIQINKNSKEEYDKQIMNDNVLYGMDYLTLNAFYAPYNNSINILLGILISVRDMNGITSENYTDKYYELLGSIGVIIGHELTHGFDNNGSKYDERGNYLNWWTNQDKEEFNKLNAKVVKYYQKYGMFGNATLGENIADLGGMKLATTIAAKKNATNDDYKKMFESYAKVWCDQKTSYYRYYILEADEHSAPNVRVNAVLSSTDKFYEVYNIKEGDKMYYPVEQRVKVW